MYSTEPHSSITIRARRRSYFVLGGIWVLVTILFLLLNIRIPEEGFRVTAILAAVFAAVWWIWLQRIRLSVSGGYVEYRGGIFKSLKTALRNIEEVRSEKTDPDSAVPGRLPQVMVIDRYGNISMVIDPKPFDRGDLEKVMDILKKASRTEGGK